jgi:hypothetical protein
MRTGLILLLVLVGACSADTQPALIASDVTITQPIPGMAMSAGYLTLTNNTEETITITRVSSPSYASVELHETVVDDGIARMRALEKIEVPAGAKTTLAPGGKHLMLMQPTKVAADSVSLQFYDGATLLLTVTSSEPRESR